MSKDKIDRALDRYYRSFDSDSGTLAYKRGGRMGFGKRYDFGSWMKNWSESGKANLNSSGAAGSIISTGVGLIGDAYKQTQYTRDPEDFSKELQGTFVPSEGVSDNSALLAFANANAQVNDATLETFRDKSVWDDAKSALGSVAKGASAGAMFGPWGALIGGAIGGLSSITGSVIGRARANNAAIAANDEIFKRNRRVDSQLFHTSQNVDNANDMLRMLAYYNNPFEYALGGEMRTHGSDFNNGFTFINEGGTHEQNPNEGVPSGLADDGTPNLVEEGEVIWNNEYVFSDRLKIPERLANKYKLGGDLTFAEAITKVTAESRERPNDPVSNETNRAIVNEFMEEQEALREQEQIAAAESLQQAYDEDFMNQMAMMQEMQGMAPQQAPMDFQMAQPQMEGMPVEGTPVMSAYGGHKFEGGGGKDEEYKIVKVNGRFYVKPKDSPTITGYTDRNGNFVVSRQFKDIPSFDTLEEAKGELERIRLSSVPYAAETSLDAAGIIAGGENKIHVRLAKNPTRDLKPRYIYTVYDHNGKAFTYDSYGAAVKKFTSVPRPAKVQGGYAYYDTHGGVHRDPKDARAASMKTASTSKESTKSKESASQQASIKGSSNSQTSTLYPPASQAPSLEITVEDNNRSSSNSARTSSSSSSSSYSSSSSSSSTRSSAKTSSVRDIESSYSDITDILKDKNTPEAEKQRILRMVNDSLPEGKQVKDVNSLISKATDGDMGPVHRAMQDAAGRYRTVNKAQNVEVPDVALNDFDYNIEFPEDNIVLDDVQVDPTLLGKSKSGSGVDWARMAPIYGTGAMALNSMLNGPDYTNADAIINAARAVGTPVNIPIQTIGDYLTYKPFDERYLVNMANQNRAAAARGIANTAGGNRAMDLLGNMSLAYNNQIDLGEIMRQAYLANQQERKTVADFNRGTNIQNMSAVNQRNLSQAQLNSQRQQAALSGLSHGYGLRQSIWQDWRNDRDANIEAFLDNLHAYSRDQFGYNQTQGLIDNGYFNFGTDQAGNIRFIPVSVEAKGGNKNRKKRRF